jgi:ABC-type nitrate/sulfonate/bicarbonate transport system permease component
MKSIILKLIIPIIFILAWQLFFSFGIWSSEILPPPAKIFVTFFNFFADGSIIDDVLASVKRVFIGFLLASTGGIIVGVLFGYSSIMKSLFSPLLEVIRPIPPIAWIPLAVLWFGLGDQPAYFLVFLGAFFPIMTNVYFGVTSVEEIHKRAALSLGAKKKEFITDILIPSALPSIFAGLKIGLGISWFMVITSELVGAQSGLGYSIQLNRLLLQTDKVIAIMVLIGVLGLLMAKGMKLLERWLIPWKLVE